MRKSHSIEAESISCGPNSLLDFINLGEIVVIFRREAELIRRETNLIFGAEIAFLGEVDTDNLCLFL